MININQEYTVIIVGAGSSGLFAANELGKVKIKTLIIEKGHHIDYRNCPMKNVIIVNPAMK